MIGVRKRGVTRCMEKGQWLRHSDELARHIATNIFLEVNGP